MAGKASKSSGWMSRFVPDAFAESLIFCGRLLTKGTASDLRERKSGYAPNDKEEGECFQWKLV